MKKQITHLEKEITFWKNTHSLLQNEYQNQVKDSTKRIDEKFDRLMFYIEESRKTGVQSLTNPLDQREQHEFENYPNIPISKSKNEKKRDRERPKKGFVIQMFRM